MNRFDRIYRLHALFKRARHPVSLDKIREELGEVSRSTAVRTLEDLRDYLGAPIDYNRARNGYYLLEDEDGPWELPGLWFNASELHALLAVHHLLTNLQPGLLNEALAPLRGRIEQILKSRHAGGGEVARRVRVLRMAARMVQPAHFRQVAEAALVRKRLCIVYHGRARNEKTEREISPQRLVHYRDNWYCDVWDHTKRALRSFAIDRIHEARALDRPAKEVPDTRLDTHFASAYGIFAGTPRRKAVLRFTPERARWVADEVWHPNQEAQRLPDGSYQLSFPYADDRELILDILKYGADVAVIAPTSLRRAVQQRLRKALAQYERPKEESPQRLATRTSRRASKSKQSRTEPLPPLPYPFQTLTKGHGA